MKKYLFICLFQVFFLQANCQTLTMLPTSDSMLLMRCYLNGKDLKILTTDIPEWRLGKDEQDRRKYYYHLLGRDNGCVYKIINDSFYFMPSGIDSLGFQVKRILHLALWIDSSSIEEINEALDLLPKVDLSKLTSLVIYSRFDTNYNFKKNLMELNILKRIDSNSLKLVEYFGNEYDLTDFFKRQTNIRKLYVDAGSNVNKHLLQLDSLEYFDGRDFFFNNLVNLPINTYSYYNYCLPIYNFFMNNGLYKRELWVSGYDERAYSEQIKTYSNYSGIIYVYFGSGKIIDTVLLKERIYDLRMYGPVLSGKRVGNWKVLQKDFIEYNCDRVPEKYVFPKNGTWEYKYNNGNTCIKGNFKKGNKNGVWFFYNPDQTINSIHYYKNDLPYPVWEYQQPFFSKYYFGFWEFAYNIKYPKGYTGYFNLDGKTILEFKNGKQIKEIKEGTKEYDEVLQKYNIKR